MHYPYESSPDVVFVSETRVKQEPGTAAASEIDRLRALLHKKTIECDQLRLEREDLMVNLHAQIGALSAVRASILHAAQPLAANEPRPRYAKRLRQESPL
jgi:hypothetical protein